MRDHAESDPRADGADLRAAGTAGRDQMPCIVRGLVVEAAGRRLLDGVDLTLDRPSITVLMGANGAGKSLLLKALHGLVAPTAGSIAWAGRPAGESVRRHQALVAQTPVLLRRSAAANIDFALATRGRRCARRRDALLAHVGLSALARQPARQLSGGERQRLAMARALALDPAVLLLDEPTASLDPASAERIEALVQGVRADGVKVVLVTHDIGQARRLADDLVFLHRGRVAEHAPAERFFAGPASAPAEAFLAGRLMP
ncbi:MAG: ATP-binding cassette domain-containing protein [Pseudomonadota bacterium]